MLRRKSWRSCLTLVAVIAYESPLVVVVVVVVVHTVGRAFVVACQCRCPHCHNACRRCQTCPTAFTSRCLHVYGTHLGFNSRYGSLGRFVRCREGLWMMYEVFNRCRCERKVVVSLTVFVVARQLKITRSSKGQCTGRLLIDQWHPCLVRCSEWT